MEKFPLELSPQVRHGRYATFSRPTEGVERLFMAGYEECAPDYIINRIDSPFWTLEAVSYTHLTLPTKRIV